MVQPFLERLQQGPILCDGAMGTQLYARGIPFEHCFDELNLRNPGIVRGIHLDYIRAGAEIIETNTFGANRIRLAKHDLEDKVREINRRGAEIARECAGRSDQPVYVAGSVGPLGKPLMPYGSISTQSAYEAFREQIEGLIEGGVDLLILETFPDLREMEQAVAAAKAVAEVPIIAQMTFGEDGTTIRGDEPAGIVARLEELGVDIIGANCSVGSQPMLAVVEQMAAVSSTPLSAQPNAGFPAYIEGRFVYLSSPEYMAGYAKRMVEAGAVIVGGCCGTTPEHIARMRDAIQDLRPPELRRTTVTITFPEPPPLVAAPLREPTTLARKLGHEFVVTVEIDPPKGFNLGKVIPKLTELKESGVVDAVNIADSPRAQARMSAAAMATLVQNQLGMETILHVTCRHRNLVALHSELLGAHAMGVRNIFIVMGDPPRIGDYPDATAVSDIVPSGLIRLVKGFNQGVDMTGKPIEEPTSFFVGAAFDPGAENLDRELRVLDKKIDSGADFLLTQPVYDPEVIERVLRRIGEFPVPVIMGVLPLYNHRHADFLHHEVPGISIPDHVRQRLKEAGDDGLDMGIQLTHELLKAVRDYIHGAYVMPPFGRYDVVAEVARAVVTPMTLREM
ncbi:MAG: bifunctional homocysteine S-methyltransferase/methylenetetrahydrofolate reductase [Chloroflexi bacterium]|nr:MAG: bifunctional homocysteine S-methyltransferase/methylenetetrahydrofolate reductase [Chloroflexota bacterium]